jgi:hypothetical protein
MNMVRITITQRFSAGNLLYNYSKGEGLKLRMEWTLAFRCYKRIDIF